MDNHFILSQKKKMHMSSEELQMYHYNNVLYVDFYSFYWELVFGQMKLNL